VVGKRHFLLSTISHLRIWPFILFGAARRQRGSPLQLSVFSYLTHTQRERERERERPWWAKLTACYSCAPTTTALVLCSPFDLSLSPSWRSQRLLRSPSVISNHGHMPLIVYFCMSYTAMLGHDIDNSWTANLWNTHFDLRVLEETRFAFLQYFNAKCRERAYFEWLVSFPIMLSSCWQKAKLVFFFFFSLWLLRTDWNRICIEIVDCLLVRHFGRLELEPQCLTSPERI
jgi:hypothetical protein